MSKKWSKIAWMLVALIAGMLLVNCSSTSSKEPDEITLQLKWLHQTQFAGVYVADQEGYYADENLIVKVNPIDLDRQVTLDYVLSGEADFAIGAAEEMIIARSEGKAVKAVAVIFRLNPLVYVARKESGINKPADLVGKSVSLGPGQATYLYEMILEQAGVDRSQINEVGFIDFDIYKCWEVADVCSHYATNAVAQANYDGIETSVIWPSDYGIPFYADVIFTTEDYIKENHDVVARFIRATLRGWQKAIEDPELATAATLVVAPDLDEGFQRAAMQASIPLIDTGQDTIGFMRPEIWQQMHELLLDQNLIPGPVNLDEVYTNEFVEGDRKSVV